MDKLKSDYEKLINSKEFDNKDYFCGAFLMMETSSMVDSSNISWQLDFYNEKSDTIVSYVINEEISKTSNSEVFKSEKMKVEKLNMNDVKVSFEEVLTKCKKVLKRHNDKSVKIIAILQNMKRPLWNISYVTQNFNLINIKIDAINGKIIEDKLVSLLSWGKIDDNK